MMEEQLEEFDVDEQESTAGLGLLKVCDICGKAFTVINPNEYTYKIVARGHTQWYCRYNHYRVEQKRLEELQKFKALKRGHINYETY